MDPNSEQILLEAKLMATKIAGGKIKGINLLSGFGERSC
jgi:hypothetical protein